jgi:tetratricopeptide (TPR) repeat protein
MRFAPIAAALSLALAVTSSVAFSREPVASPQAAALIADGRAALKGGKTQAAIDAFEAALAVDPAYSPVLLDLAAAARKEGLTGKAIAYYREMLTRDPRNLSALAGEGVALVEKGAVEKARGKLSQLTSLCGGNCPQARELSAAIARGPAMPALAAETAVTKPAQN